MLEHTEKNIPERLKETGTQKRQTRKSGIGVSASRVPVDIFSTDALAWSMVSTSGCIHQALRAAAVWLTPGRSPRRRRGLTTPNTQKRVPQQLDVCTGTRQAATEVGISEKKGKKRTAKKPSNCLMERALIA